MKAVIELTLMPQESYAAERFHKSYDDMSGGNRVIPIMTHRIVTFGWNSEFKCTFVTYEFVGNEGMVFGVQETVPTIIRKIEG